MGEDSRIEDYKAIHYLNGDTLKQTQNRKNFIETDQAFLSDIETIVKLEGTAFTLFSERV